MAGIQLSSGLYRARSGWLHSTGLGLRVVGFGFEVLVGFRVGLKVTGFVVSVGFAVTIIELTETVGILVGIAVGITVGEIVGMNVGVSVGKAVGVVVGIFDDTSDCEGLGVSVLEGTVFTVGKAVGIGIVAVGLVVGRVVGFSVGLKVGLVVGLAVGWAVGVMVTKVAPGQVEL